jgi:NAD(P)-dependent dehydrogenase (short-subunit alcohol dehydrogenase family)
MDAGTKVVLVAGASSGIGQAAAEALVRRGHHVFGTSRDPTRISTNGVEPLALEVSDEASVQRCVARLVARAARLDAVFYSAGFYVAGAVEETTLAQVAAQMDVYFFGACRVARAVLPVMRAQHAGRLVFMSSSAGVAAIPFHAAYSASKGALESFCESLAYETAPFGIDVSYVQATGVRTAAAASMQAGAEPVEVYAAARERVVACFKQTQQDGPSPSAIADTVAAIVEAKRRPRVCYRVGLQARLVPFLKGTLPSAIFRQQVRKLFGA